MFLVSGFLFLLECRCKELEKPDSKTRNKKQETRNELWL
jgi:hypothetical protein